MIRLQRVGRKNIPIFRVVVTDRQNSTKSGKYLESVGSYDPRQGGIRQFKADRIKRWLSHGAKLSGTLHNLFIDEKIIEGKKVDVSPRKKSAKESSSTGVSAATEAGAALSNAAGASTPIPETPTGSSGEAKELITKTA